jgi:hypothetical protein
MISLLLRVGNFSHNPRCRLAFWIGRWPISLLNAKIPCRFPCFQGICLAETGSRLTACATTQSGNPTLCGDLLNSPAIGGLFQCALVSPQSPEREDGAIWASVSEAKIPVPDAEKLWRRELPLAAVGLCTAGRLSQSSVGGIACKLMLARRWSPTRGRLRRRSNRNPKGRRRVSTV